MGWMQTVRRMVESRQRPDLAGPACPRCAAVLTRTDTGEFGRVILDVCSRCQGLWLEATELNQLDGSVWVNLEDHAFHENPGDHARCNCPRCRVPLKPVSATDLSDVILDKCPACSGFWLDSGELELLRAAVQRSECEPASLQGDQKPKGWSDLRWRLHQVHCARD